MILLVFNFTFYINSFMTEDKSMDWFLYDNDLRHERVNPLTTSVSHDIETSQLFFYDVENWSLMG